MLLIFKKSSDMKKLIYLFLLSMTILIACDKEDDDPITPGACDNTSYTYTNDIKSIFDASCAFSGCHDVATQSGGKNLTTYAGVNAAGLTSIVAAIEHTGPIPMPYQLPKLPNATIQKIKCWVSKGAPE